MTTPQRPKDNLTPEQRKKWNERSRYWAQRVLTMLNYNAPDSIVAHTIVCLYRCALGSITETMLTELNNGDRENARRYAGRCLECGGDLPFRKTFNEYCDSCAGKHVAEHFRIEMEYDDEFIDEEDN